MFGGVTETGNATGNKVYIGSLGGTVTNSWIGIIEGFVSGGVVLDTGGGNADGNEVYVAGGTVLGRITGGYSNGGNADGNTVNVTGGIMGSITDGHSLYGGYSESGTANDNIVSVSGSASTPFSFANVGQYIIYGGSTQSGGEANNNQVTVGGTAADTMGIGSVWGGNVTASPGEATGNTVTVAGGQIGSDGIVGGSTVDGDATDNAVTVRGGGNLVLTGDIMGAWASGTGDASGNRVTVSDVAAAANSVYGGYSTDGSANENIVAVTLNAGQRFAYVIGGETGSAVATDGASGNIVTISGAGSVTNNVYGGYASGAGNANGNAVTVSGATINGFLYGGFAATDGKEAMNNTITINSGTYNGDVVGGYAGLPGISTGNTVNIFGGAFNTAYGIYGGWNPNNVTGNTLNTRGVIGIQIGTIANFETYNFTVDTSNVRQTVYTVTNPVDVSGSIVNVTVTGNDPLSAGDYINLFSKTTGTAPTQGNVQGMPGSLFDYDAIVEINTASADEELRVRILGSSISGDTQLYMVRANSLACKWSISPAISPAPLRV